MSSFSPLEFTVGDVFFGANFRPFLTTLQRKMGKTYQSRICLGWLVSAKFAHFSPKCGKKWAKICLKKVLPDCRSISIIYFGSLYATLLDVVDKERFGKNIVPILLYFGEAGDFGVSRPLPPSNRTLLYHTAELGIVLTPFFKWVQTFVRLCASGSQLFR